MFVDAAAPGADRLPPELEARAVVRLSWMILVIAGLFLASIPMRAAMAWADGYSSLSLLSTLLSTAFGGASLLALVVVRLAPVPRRLVLQIGLLYEVLVCLGLALVEQILVGFVPMPLRLSVVAALVLVFPLAIPTPPRWRMLTTFLSALTVPVAMAWVAWLTGRFEVRSLVLGSAPTLLVALVAAWLGLVMHRLRLDADRALAFGQYELVEKLGEGGMGEVWRARHARLLRPAAIKLIRPATAGLYGASARARFQREAQATGALRSPHTVSLYDYGRTEDGTLYYAMELLEGIDSEQLVKRFGPMPAERVLHILRQVARSLAEAHQLGLVHRDIKPANVFLCRVGIELDFVKVLDLGLVKPRHVASDSPVSVAGAVSGTPGYVAPEHLAGKELDGRADLYSLGCVAYFLLTGKRVFSARNKMELDRKSVV